MLVDTGATDTILSSTLYHRIPGVKRPHLNTSISGVRNADGSELSTLGSGWVELRVGACISSLQVVFGNTGSMDGILGMDFLLQHQANLDLKTKELNLNGERIKCTDGQGTSFCARVVVGETTRVPAGHEALISGHVKSNTDRTGFGLIEPAHNELTRKGILVARVLVGADDTTLPIRVYNPGHKECVVKRGTLAGYITHVTAGDIEEKQTDSRVTGNMEEVPEHLKDLYERAKQGVEETHHNDIAKLLCEYQDVFAKSDVDIGRTNKVRHGINTGDHPPLKERPRRFPLKEQEEIDRQIKQLLDTGMIEPSDSPWASNVVLVKKKDGTKRFCIDYRRLNKVTIKDAYPIPRIDDSLDALGGSKWFSTLDLASGYWQVELDEDAKKKSAFVVRGGLYCWNVMPFGLTNAPSTFERLMERVLSGLHWQILLVYLDDIIVYAKTVEEELRRLATVFQRLRESGLKLKAKKCHLFKESVLYLGHIVSAQGISTDPEKVRAVKEWPTPTTVKEVQSFLGLASYYRRFIAGFSNIARPLHRLTEKGQQFAWSEACDAAFIELKGRLQEAPILAYPIPDLEYLLDTDASNEGIGAVLSQVIDGKERVISYASRVLNKAERNYCTTRKELLAVVVFLKQFRQYLYGQPTTIRTDHGALRWLLNFRDIQGQMARWLQVISEYDVNIVHRAGRSHANADSLSRRPCTECTQCDIVEGDCPKPNTRAESNPVSNSDDCAQVKAVHVEPSITISDMREAQLGDDTIRCIVECKEKDGVRPDWSNMESQSNITKSYWRMWDQLEMIRGVLHRRWESDSGDVVQWKIILPEEYRKHVVTELHGGHAGGHLGTKKTIAKVRLRYHWPKMDADVRSIIRMCNTCASKKSPSRTRRAPLQQRSVGMPMERVALDIVGPLPETERGNKYLLVVGDYFSKWVEVYPIPDQTAKTVAEKFVQEFVCRFGVPQVLHSDQGRNFESQVFAEMCSILGIDKTRTTPYNPKSDGFVERFNRTLISMVSMMIDPTRRQRDWDEKVPLALFGYRSSPQESTGETPNMLMLGREVCLPIDLTMETAKEDEEIDPVMKTDYALALRERMGTAHQRARRNLAKAARHQKRTYDRRAEKDGLQVGKFVWCFNPAKTKGLTPKLQRRWKGPYLVTHKLSDVVYRLQMKPHGKMMVVHSDRLKPYQGEKLDSWIEEPEVELSYRPGEENDMDQDVLVEIPSLSSTESEAAPSDTVVYETNRDQESEPNFPVPAPRRVMPVPAPRRNPARQRIAPKRLIQEML